MGVDTCTPGVAGRSTRGRGAALIGGYVAEDRCLEKKEGCVSALQSSHSLRIGAAEECAAIRILSYRIRIWGDWSVAPTME